MKHQRERGMTLVEVMVAITLVSLLSVGMLYSIRLGMDSMHRVNQKFVDSRRMIGAQRILEQQLAGFMLVPADCRTGAAPDQNTKLPFFQGEGGSMRFVTSFSLTEAYRGWPKLLEFAVIPGAADIGGVRLVVNELPYTGPRLLGELCRGQIRDEAFKTSSTIFVPVIGGPGSFVLADRLAYCRITYLDHRKETPVERWLSHWPYQEAPSAIRIDMAPLLLDPSRLQPMSITAPVHVNRTAQAFYAD